MCRERTISFPRPTAIHGASQEPAPKQGKAPKTEIAQDADIAGVIRANLLRLCQARDLSLRSLAALADVNLAELNDLATGRSFPGLGLLLKLARALDVPCTAFIEAPVTAGGNALSRPLRVAWER